MEAKNHEIRSGCQGRSYSDQPERLISHRQVLEQLAISEFRAGRMTRRGYARFVQMALEYKFSEAEAKGMIQEVREQLADEGLILPAIATVDDSSSARRTRLLAVALVVLLVQGLWWILY